MKLVREYIIRTLLFAWALLLLFSGCDEAQNMTAEEVDKITVKTSIVPSKNIQSPVAIPVQEPEALSLEKPVKLTKKKKKSIDFTKSDFEFIPSEKVQLNPGHPRYPSSTPIQSKPTLAKLPKYGLNTSDWKTVDKKYLQLTEKEGLEMLSNNGLYQGPEGHIWGSTRWGGAWKYDGYQFVHYYEDVGLEDYSVVNLFFDRDGDAWFGMSTGLAKFDGSHFTHYTGEREVSKRKPTKFAEDHYGNIWIGSMDGLYRLDKKQNTITHFTKENGLLIDEVSALHCDHSGQIWITYNQLGLSLLSVDLTEDGFDYDFSNYKVNDIAQFQNVQCLHSNQKGQIFAGTDAGFIQINPNKMGSINPVRASRFVDSKYPYLFVYAMTEDQSGRLWMGTNRYLLSVDFDENNRIADNAVFNVEDGLLSLNVTGVVVDQENYLWLSYLDLGITKVDLNHSFRSISEDYGLEGYVIGGFEDKWQNVWFVIYKVGLFCLRKPKDGSEEYLLQYNEEQNIVLNVIGDIEMDDEGNIWIGGYNELEKGANLLKLELTKDGTDVKVHQYTKAGGLELRNISDLMIDDEGAIWMAENTLSTHDKDLLSSGGGVYKLEGNQLWSYGESQGLLSPDTYRICQDKQGNYWFNSYYYGVTKFDPTGNNHSGTWIHYNLGKPQGSLIQHDSDGIYSNSLDGLLHFPSKVDTPYQEIRRFAKNNDLWSSAIVPSFFKDFNNNYWALNPDGVDRVTLSQTGGNPQEQYTYESYTKLDGLVGRNFHNIFQTSDSIIYICPSTQLLAFQPKDVIKEPEKKEVVLHKVLLFDEDVKWSQGKNIQLKNQKVLSDFSFDTLSRWINIPQKLSLTYQDNYIGFEYSSVEVDRPHKVEYRHFLEGYENGWNSASKNTKISYPNLPHGKYTLHLAARMASGEWGSPLKYSFEIRPPWWHSWWAYYIYIVFVVTLLYLFYQFQLNRNLEKAEATRLKELDVVKTRLYTNITHEFRTPLTVISGMTDQIEENPKEWFKDGLSMIRRNTNRLLELVNQMLDLNKLESGKINLKNQQSDILTYLKYIVESIQSFANSNKIKVHFLSEEEEIMMDFDPENIQRVMMNLLSNALKFTPDEGDIYVSVRRISYNGHPSTLMIKVKDTGSGIPESQLPFIFDRFYQVDDSSTRRGEGSGIGLALIKELVKLMKGEISVSSKLGEETVFTVLLPINNVEKEIDIQIPKTKKGKTNSHRVEINNGGVLSIKGNNELLIDGVIPRILIVEDNSDVVAYIASCLKDDYQIQVGKNGQEGIDIAIENIPDLIITDIMMPVKDGFEVTRTLKRDERTSHIPIIMLTAKADLESKLEGLEKGADAYLAKPFHKVELRVRIKKLLELRKKLQKHYLQVAGSSSLSSSENVETPIVEDQFVIKLREVVEAHLEDFDFSVEQFCKEVAISRSQLHRKLTALTGLSPNKFIRHIRLNKAKVLLDDSDIAVNIVAYETGFGDPGYFSRVFKKEFGVTPLEWRERINK